MFGPQWHETVQPACVSSTVSNEPYCAASSFAAATTFASAAAWVMNASSGAMSSRPSRRSFTYWRMHFSNEPRYFLHTAILPFRTSMQGFRCRRFAPSAATAEQRPPFRM